MKYMSWTFWRLDYAMQEIFDNGDRIYQLGMFDYVTEFTFKDPSKVIFDKDNVSGVTGRIKLDVYERAVSTDRSSPVVYDKYMDWVRRIKEKWPHIKWYFSIRNEGTYAAIKCLMDNENGVQDTFINELSNLIDNNTWITGIDLDLEHCGGRDNADNMKNLIKRVSDLVHSKKKLLHYDLPAMNGEYFSVGSENWCSYKRLNPYLDSVTIMSYDFAWQGSAPSAVSPASWLTIVYDYVAKSFDTDKVFMGLPGYGYCWQIDHYPDINNADWYQQFRGHTMRFAELLEWQNGLKSHCTAQPKVPFASYVKDDEKCAYMYLHIYDYQGFDDAVVTAPANKGSFNNNNFISTYKKTLIPKFENIIVDRLAVNYDKAGGNLILIEDAGGNCLTSHIPVSPPTSEGEDVWGYATYFFDIQSGGDYDIVLDINFNWFDRDRITVELGSYYTEHVEWQDESGATQSDDVVRYTPIDSFEAKIPYLHYNFALNRHYVKVGTISLDSGKYYIKYLCEASAPDAFFYGFRICSKYDFSLGSGKAKFRVQPQTFLDSNMNEVQPQTYKITFEVLRRDPDYCYIWSDDFRSYVEIFEIFDRYYMREGGHFSATGENTGPCTLIQSSSTGHSQFKVNYTSFPDIYVKTQFKHVGEEIGILIGNNTVGLKGGSIVLNNGAMSKEVQVKEDMNELAVRIRGSECKVWFNGFDVFTASAQGSEIAGLYTNNASYECYLFEVRDAHNMYTQECISVVTPAGDETLGRIERQVSSYDSFWNTLYINSGQEEKQTRTEEISSDWDYLHTKEFTASGDFDVEINFDDIGFWLKSVYLCDKNGSSIAFYNDISSYMYWFNECTNKYKLKGAAIWCTGEENPLIYKYLDKEV